MELSEIPLSQSMFTTDKNLFDEGVNKLTSIILFFEDKRLFDK